MRKSTCCVTLYQTYQSISDPPVQCLHGIVRPVEDRLQRTLKQSPCDGRCVRGMAVLKTSNVSTTHTAQLHNRIVPAITRITLHPT